MPLLASHPDAGPPFVQPVISSMGMEKWARKSEGVGMREDVYMSLIEGPIRRAWVSPYDIQYRGNANESSYTTCT